MPLTLAIVILTALAGTYLVRSQGADAMRRIQFSLQGMEDPTTPLADGVMILFAGALLLTPGFFTDAFGFALLIPQSRAIIRRYVSARVKTAQFTTQTTSHQRHQAREQDVIITTDNEEVSPKGDSGWTKP